MRDFEKTRLGEILASTPQEAALCEMILNFEISMAMRSMGAAKDFDNNDLKMLGSQVLHGFFARKNNVSFATMLLFFKMRRARLYPCNSNSYGMNPLSILDNFNDFLEWQKSQVAQAQANNRQQTREEGMAKTLAQMPYDFQQKIAESRRRLKEMEREQKKSASLKAAYEMQIKRLYSILYFKFRADNQNVQEHIAKSKVELQLKEFLNTHQPKNGVELREVINQHFKVERTILSEPASVLFTEDNQVYVQIGTHNGNHKINAAKPIKGSLLDDFINF